MRTFVRLFSLTVLFSSLISFAQADKQNPPTEAEKTAAPRARIALALEGGGALGLAHIGVLEWFDEHHIPVDVIAGTSMGGLIGGFYASGMQATEIKEFAAGINWNKALRNQIPYGDLAFRRKEDKRAYPADLEFGLKGGVHLPIGFNSGQEVGLILDRIGAPYVGMDSFDELPTPFRCVATDLVSGNAVVFDRGSLADALRGTMSLPGVFNPVRENGQVYVDGGLVDNLPVDVARSMGADIVIAVHLETQPIQADEKLSAFSVLENSISVVIARNELESMEKADVVIPVHSEAYSTLDYQAAEKIIGLGYSGAEERARLLRRFALGDQEWSEYVARRESRRRPLPIPQFVEVTGTAPVIAQGIQRNLADNVNRPVDFDRLDADLTDVTGLGRFSRAGFQLTTRDGKPGLL